jgi:transcriptional regulator with XRE-family HTH domain
VLDNVKVGKNILDLRKGLSLTQIELSNLLGVSHQAVSKWEQGECLPDIEVLLKLGQVFSKSVEELLLSERVYGEPANDEVLNTKIEVSAQLDVWTKVLGKIESEISIPSFNTWFKSTKAEYEESTYVIYSPSNFTTEWLYQRYSKFIMQILEEITGESDFKIEFRSMGKSSTNFESSLIPGRASLRLS